MIYKTVSTTLTTTPATIYTTPNHLRANVKSVLVTNILTTGTATVLLDWYTFSSSTQFTLMKNVELPLAGLIQITDALWLEPKDYIIGSSGANTSVTITLMLELVSTKLTIN